MQEGSLSLMQTTNVYSVLYQFNLKLYFFVVEGIQLKVILCTDSCIFILDFLTCAPHGFIVKGLIYES